jgi:enoyl-CoA hydratase/carnithine racemase
MSETAPIEVFAARDTTEAYFVRSLLKMDGIDAVVVGDNLRAIVGELPPLQTTVRLWVPPYEADRARLVVAEYNRRQRDRAAQGSQAGAAAPESTVDPFCYHCGQSVSLGQSPCPACGKSLEWDSEDLASVSPAALDQVSSQLLTAEVVEGIAVLTLNHPERRNALSRAMLAALTGHLIRLGRDKGVRVVIIRASGTVFSSGHDLREMVDAAEEDHRSLFALCAVAMKAIRDLEKPVIAEVQGVATAGGCQLVASCDLVVASENATFATPGVRIGLFCTTPAIPLVRVVPTKKAMEMLLTGDPISAREAERLGLVNRVVPADILHEETMKLAHRIASASASTLALGKRAFYRQLALDLDSAYELGKEVMVRNALAPDAQEGICAFLEKRAPRWQE